MRSRHQVTKRKPVEDRTTVDGQVFHSVGEMRRYEVLRSRLDVRAIQRQVKFPVVMRDCMCVEVPVLTPNGRPMSYTIDFIYEELQNSDHGGSVWTTVYEEYKGIDDPAQQVRRGVVARYNRFQILITGPAAKKLKQKDVQA